MYVSGSDVYNALVQQNKVKPDVVRAGPAADVARR